MSTNLQKIVILGGGGHVGSIILRGLLLSPDLTITAVKRPASTSSFPESENLKVVESDLSFDSLVSIFTGQDAVISVVGATGIGEQKSYVDAAVKASVKRFFPSEFGVNGQSEAVKELTPFFSMKQDLLDYLVTKEKDGLTWTGVIVGVLFEFCLLTGFMGFNVASKQALIWDDGNTRFSNTTGEDLGKAVVNILHKPAETANKFIYVSSLTVTQNEMLKALEKATSAKWEVTRVTTEKQLGDARVALGQGDLSGAYTLVKATIWSNAPGLKQHYEVEEKERLANELLGVTGEQNVQDAVERAIEGSKSTAGD